MKMEWLEFYNYLEKNIPDKEVRTAVRIAGWYGMGPQKLAKLLGDVPTKNIADAYRPEGLP